jgi:hypothetical protein
MWCESSSASVGHDIPTKEDVSTLSATSSSSCSSFYYGDESSSTFSDTSHDLHHPGTPSDNEQDLVYLNDCSKPMHIVKQPSIYVDTQQVTVQRSVNPNANDAIPSRSMTTQKETVQASGVCPSLPSPMHTMVEPRRFKTGTDRLDLPSSASDHCFPTCRLGNPAPVVLQGYGVGCPNRHAERVYRKRHHCLCPASCPRQE